jgi:hypothetical protein
MSMTDTQTDREKMAASLASLLERAESTDPDWALTNETPLSLEVSGKYVNVLFSTGGPHTELTAEYADAEDAEYWFENTPQGAWFTRMDWGTREDKYIGPHDAGSIMQAITRDTEGLEEVDADTDE